MKDIHTKPIFYVILIIVGFIALIVYQLNKLPTSFEVTTASVLGLGETINRYENRNEQYFKIIKTRLLGKETILSEIEITKQEFKDAYNQYSLV